MSQKLRSTEYSYEKLNTYESLRARSDSEELIRNLERMLRMLEARFLGDPRVIVDSAAVKLTGTRLSSNLKFMIND